MNKELAIECIKTQRQFVDDMTREAFDMAIDLIEEAFPIADVAPVRHGRWDFDMSGAWCSVCGEYSEGRYCYCPNCGAKMDGESDEWLY